MRDRRRKYLTKNARILVAALSGYVVTHMISFLGAPLLAVALRELVTPQMPALLGPSSAEFVRSTLPTYLSLMVTTTFLAPFAGLLGAGVSRHLGRWRLLTPALALGWQALHTLRTASHMMQQPFVTDAPREGIAMMQASFYLWGLATLFAIVPGMLGAWLGTKLWPAKQPEPDLERVQ